MLSVGDVCELPYQSSFFDAVITTDSCCFWNDPKKVFSEIRRVLKDDGIFINTFNTMYADSRIGNSDRHIRHNDLSDGQYTP